MTRPASTLAVAKFWVLGPTACRAKLYDTRDSSLAYIAQPMLWPYSVVFRELVGSSRSRRVHHTFERVPWKAVLYNNKLRVFAANSPSQLQDLTSLCCACCDSLHNPAAAASALHSLPGSNGDKILEVSNIYNAYIPGRYRDDGCWSPARPRCERRYALVRRGAPLLVRFSSRP